MYRSFGLLKQFCLSSSQIWPNFGILKMNLCDFIFLILCMYLDLEYLPEIPHRIIQRTIFMWELAIP